MKKRKVVKDERSKPAKEGRNVVYDYKNRCLRIDNEIIDRSNPPQFL